MPRTNDPIEALARAAERGDAETFSRRLRRLSPDERVTVLQSPVPRKGASLLSVAAFDCSGSRAGTPGLLEVVHGALDEERWRDLMCWDGDTDDTLLGWAVRMDFESVARFILQTLDERTRLDLLFRHDKRMTPLCWAMRHGKPHMVELLIAHCPESHRQELLVDGLGSEHGTAAAQAILENRAEALSCYLSKIDPALLPKVLKELDQLTLRYPEHTIDCRRVIARFRARMASWYGAGRGRGMPCTPEV